MAKLQWGQKTPGHLVFLIDQSTSMNVKDANGKTRAEKVVEAVQDAIINCVDMCIAGTSVKNRFFLTIIGYGGEPTPTVTTIKEDWAKNLIPDLQALKTNGGTFIPVEALGWTPMAEAFDLAKECLEGWFEACQEKVDDGSYLGIPAPIIINITDGEPCDGSSTAKERAEASAKELLSLSGTDGNVTLFNLHISDEGTEIVFPSDKAILNGCPEGEFLFDLSSDMPDEIAESARQKGIEGVCAGAKCMAVNVKGGTITTLINVGSDYSKIANNN